MENKPSIVSYALCNIFTYTKDGRYPIDNNLVEHAVHSLTTHRNSMFHYGNDEGVEMAATYHSIISIVKIQRRSFGDYLGKFLLKYLTVTVLLVCDLTKWD
ncbi:IS66 family transposase [Bacteroides congonensis]